MKEYIERAVAVQELEVLRQEYEMHDDCDELVARRCRDALSAVPPPTLRRWCSVKIANITRTQKSTRRDF